MTLKSKTVIALVPARGGSKGVYRKNMREIAGRPLIDFTLRAALDSNIIDETYISSDDEDILKYANMMDIGIIKRPPQISSDFATASDVVEHFFSVMSDDVLRHDPYIVYLQPTSPLRSATPIDKALNAMSEAKFNTLVSVTELSKSPFKSFVISASGTLESLFDEKLTNARRQDLPVAYIPNGAIYVFRVSDFLEHRGFPSNGSYPFVMSEIDSIDIDTEDDICNVERILGGRNGRN
jgi:CMP-N,N'-diacetyllegionaminic acid synthase